MDEAERRAEFTAYVRAREVALARLAYFLTGDRATAEDLLQSALAKVYRHWEHVGSVELPDAYVRRVMVNENNSHWRRFARRLDFPASQVLEVVAPPVSSGLDPAESIDLWEQVRRLPRQQRAVVVLRYYEDLTEAQAAAVMGVRPGTIKSQTRHALMRLRQLAPDLLARAEPVPEGAET